MTLMVIDRLGHHQPWSVYAGLVVGIVTGLMISVRLFGGFLGSFIAISVVVPEVAKLAASATGWIFVPLLVAGVGILARKKIWILARKKRADSALAVFCISGLTALAAQLAGRKRPSLLAEWQTHLTGESGDDPVTWRKSRQALGFVAAAIHLRLQDAADLAWRPADAVLGSRTLSNLFVGGPVIVVLFAIVHHDGRFGLVSDIQDAGELGAILYGVIRVGRWWRQIKPPEPKPRRARE